MARRNKVKRQLRSMARTEGNFGFKALLLAALEDQQAVGEALTHGDYHTERALKEREDDLVTSTVTPAALPEDTNERSLARSEFSESEMESEIPASKYLGRMLLNESHTELDVLWREELLDTVIEGAKPRQIARDASAVFNVDTRKGDIPRGSPQVYADSVAEGAEIPMNEENYDTVSYDAQKYAQGFQVTDELLDHAQPDVIERNIRFTGAAVENAINRVWLTELLDNANNTHDTGQTAADVSDVNAAAELVEMDDFGPVDSLVMHPEFKKDLFDDSNLVYANRAGSDDVLTNREFNPIMGTELFTGSNGTYDGTGTWGFNAGGEIGAAVYQREMMGLVIYRDIETKDFEDPIRDLQGGNARAYVDAKWLQPDAGATVTY